MKELVERVRTSIYLIMCVLFSMLVYIYIDYLFKRSTSFWFIAGIIITVIVVVDYMTRRYVTNLVLFFLIHILLVAVAVLIPPSVTDKIVLGVIASAYLFLAFGFWRTESNERSMYVIDIPMGVILFFVLVYMHASASKSISDAVAVYAYIAGILYFILYFIRQYLNKFLSYTLTSGNFTNEMKGTFTTNLSLIMIFNLIVVFAIMLSNIFFSDSIFNFIGRFLRFLARKFFGYLQKVDNSEPSRGGSVEIEIQTGEQETMPETSFTPSGKSSEVGEIIFKVVTVVIFIVAIGAVLLMIYRFIKQYLHRHNVTTDVIEKVGFEEKREKVKEKSVAPKKSIFLSDREKIRKIYANRVKRISKKNDSLIIRDSFTTEEILTSVNKYDVTGADHMETLTSIYKKARYSDHEITKEDVELAKLKA